MRNIWSITKKEVRTYFSSPIAYVVIFVFTLLVGFFFTNIITWFNAQAMQMAQNPYYYQQANINQMVYSPLFGNMSIILLLVLPMLTMRLFAEEKKSGSDELLFTSPISIVEIILGKYIASLFVLAVMLGLTALLSFFSFAFGNPEFAPVFSGYLGLFLMGAAFIAIGLFFSSLTDSQIVAAVLTFGALLFFWVINWASGTARGVLRGVLDYLSIFQHFDDFTQGIVDTIHVVYYLSFIFLGLFLTHSWIQSRRWR